MQQTILEKKILSKILEFRNDILAVIVFGSSIYMGRGRDVDLVVIVRDYMIDSIKDSINLRMYINKYLGYKVFADIHVLSINDFRNNLKIGSFLTGLALGYKILYDETGTLEDEIIAFLERISKTDYVLVNRYGKWRLKYHAQIMLKRMRDRNK